VTCYVDTSANLAVLDADDRNHIAARERWQALLGDSAVLVSSDYVLVETYALVQSRLGLKATRVFTDDVLPAVAIEWVGESDFRNGLSGLVAASRRKLSLADGVSFVIMRRRGIRCAFCFDRHFAEQGFEVLP